MWTSLAIMAVLSMLLFFEWDHLTGNVSDREIRKFFDENEK